ncbi:MAG: TRIC cation channel family protein, partial [Planctomycetaceae bacterium]|nr:TRIC cation channel family protein [Planctomycetaceae bacterium]
LPDALGLGLFSVVGANAAIEAGTSYFVAALMGAVTGTFGGVIGDIICNRVPSLFRPAPLFATCSFVGCWVFLLLNTWVVSRPYAAPAAIVVIVAFRLAAIRYKWFLPQVESAVSTVGEDQHPNVDS